jgi:hypothetical protein
MTWYSGAPNCAKSLTKVWMSESSLLYRTLISCRPVPVLLMGACHHEPTHCPIDASLPRIMARADGSVYEAGVSISDEEAAT